MARPRKYKTAASLQAALEGYFDSISRIKTVTEDVPTGKMDKYGHAVVEQVPVCNRYGEVCTTLEFVVPPTVGGLCRVLGIHRSTWWEYCDPEKHPEFADVTGWARNILQGYLEEQLLSRDNVRGIIFDLQANYGVREKAAEDMDGVSGVKFQMSDFLEAGQ